MTTVKQIEHEAIRDALAHEEQFPRHPIPSCWEVEAWSEVQCNLELTEKESKELWPVYHRALHQAAAGGPTAVGEQQFRWDLIQS
jgi:hypothetical protein